MLRILGAFIGLGLIVVALTDAFETIVQPRRVTRRIRLARFFYRAAWGACRSLALHIRPGKRREAFLGAFGPLSLLGLFASWVVILIVGFAVLNWSIGVVLRQPDDHTTLFTFLYHSGTTFFTLGYGDVTPIGLAGRSLAVIESGLGFGFLAAVIGYLPALSQAYSRRELTISLLDARAGSPPAAGELLARLGQSRNIEKGERFLEEWEQWAGELLESHLSFPVLSFYRSQHDNQSWLAALTCILDTCAILIASLDAQHSYQAQLTFAMARHAAVDLGLVLGVTPPKSALEDRLPVERQTKLYDALREAHVSPLDAPAVGQKLAELRSMYEPFIFALAQRLLFTVPPVILEKPAADNWQRSAWMGRTPGIGSLPSAVGDEGHFG